jgi:FHS family L-fucose permease-like MFS transporter
MEISGRAVKLDGEGAGGKFFWSLALLATLFFMWGFITVLNDALTPHLKSVFVMDYAQAALIQVSWFLGYLVFSWPSAKLVEAAGYKISIVVGLVIMALGCLMFVPAAGVPSYNIFLAALLVVAGGVALLQVAANPYVAVLGPPETSSTRLNLVQSFNSFGTLLAPLFGSYLILGRSVGGTAKAGTVLTLAQRLEDAKAVQAPYIGIAVVLLLIGVAIFIARLPKVKTHPESDAERKDSIWRHPVFTLGVIAIFVYVGAEVAVGNYLISYIASPHVKNVTTAEASRLYLPFYWGGLWVGRLVGSQLMRVIHPSILLAFNAVAAVVAITLSIYSQGDVALWAILAIGLCNSIMFPTIFTQAIQGLGPLTGRASGFLIMAIFGGGVVPYIQGWLADHIGLALSYFTSVPCYLFIVYFAWRARGSKAPEATVEAQAA